MSTFTFDGQLIPFAEGQSVGAALVAAGTYSWRTTRDKGRPRGIFCGIGVCYDCLIMLEGVPNQRACLIAATPGMVLSTQVKTGHDALVV